MKKPTDVPQFISELGAGITIEQLSVVLSDAAAAALTHDRKSSVTLKIGFERIGKTGTQLKVTSNLAFKMPKARGTKSEDEDSDTAMYVNESGTVTVFPESQADMFNNRDETTASER